MSSQWTYWTEKAPSLYYVSFHKYMVKLHRADELRYRHRIENHFQNIFDKKRNITKISAIWVNKIRQAWCSAPKAPPVNIMCLVESRARLQTCSAEIKTPFNQNDMYFRHSPDWDRTLGLPVFADYESKRLPSKWQWEAAVAFRAGGNLLTSSITIFFFNQTFGLPFVENIMWKLHLIILLFYRRILLCETFLLFKTEGFGPCWETSQAHKRYSDSVQNFKSHKFKFKSL